MARTRTAAVGVALAGAAALAASAAVQPALAQEDDRGLRAATGIASKYVEEQRALAHGYVRPGPPHDCVQHPTLGYMGYHYVNPELMDRVLEPGKPEAVLYKQVGGKRVLTGIEYIVVAEDQVAPYSDHDKPSLWGHEFQGPMEGHGPGMPVHYDLHVWTHDDNPAGAWEPWNASDGLSCP